MFGLGLFEILIILIVALMVLGPEKLVQTTLTISREIKKLIHLADTTKKNIEREVGIDDLNENLNKNLLDQQFTDSQFKTKKKEKWKT